MEWFCPQNNKWMFLQPLFSSATTLWAFATWLVKQGMLTMFPQCNSLLEFLEILSQNLVSYHTLSESGNFKIIHRGILINMPYHSAFTIWWVHTTSQFSECTMCTGWLDLRCSHEKITLPVTPSSKWTFRAAVKIQPNITSCIISYLQY